MGIRQGDHGAREFEEREIGPIAEFEISWAAEISKLHISASAAESLLATLRTCRLTSPHVANVGSYPTIMKRMCQPGYYVNEPYADIIKQVSANHV
jgi:hypothetical protein